MGAAVLTLYSLFLGLPPVLLIRGLGTHHSLEDSTFPRVRLPDLPANEQEKIFEKFYRCGDPLVHNIKGSGLGLSLVRHIARAHGGDVLVESTPEKGSKFTIALPLDPALRSVEVAA